MRWDFDDEEIEIQVPEEIGKRILDLHKEGVPLPEAIMRVVKEDRQLLKQLVQGFIEAGLIIDGPTGRMIYPFSDE